MLSFADDFSNPDLERFYEILPGVGNLARRNDGLHYAITRGPDGPTSPQTFFTIDSLGRPQPPTAKAVLEYRGSEWSLEAVVDYEFERKTNGRSAHLCIAFGEAGQAYQHGLALVRSADLDPASHSLVACMHHAPAEPLCQEITRTPRRRNWFRVRRADCDLTVEWSEDGVAYKPVLRHTQVCSHISQFFMLNSYAFAGGASFVLRSLKIIGAEVIAAPPRPRAFTSSDRIVNAVEIIEALEEHRDIEVTNCEISGVIDLGVVQAPITSNICMNRCRFANKLVGVETTTLSGIVLLQECLFEDVGLSNAHFTQFFQAVNCEFGRDTRFIETNFGAGADFSLSRFREKPFFRMAQAGGALSFYHCNFIKGADLSSGRFGGDLSISDIAVESGTVTFYGSEIKGTLRFVATLQRDPQPTGDAIELSEARIGALVISAGDRQNPGEYTGPPRWFINSGIFLRKAHVVTMLLFNVSFRNLFDLSYSSIRFVTMDGAEFEQVVGEWPVETEYYSCFLSYSSQDHLFANQLYNDLVKSGAECWFAPEAIKMGDEFRELIIRAIRKYDRFLLVLSAASVASAWVEFEVKTALERERSEKRKVLVPICLDDSVQTSPQEWARNIAGKRQIGDFRRWTDPDEYRTAFERLRQELKPQKA